MIDEKLAIIKENNQKVFDAGKFKTLNKSKYMHPTVSGAVISVNDVNALEHKLGVKVTSKNLWHNGTVKLLEGLSNNNGVFVQTNVDTKSYLHFVMQTYDGTKYDQFYSGHLYNPTVVSGTFTKRTNANLLRVGHNGSSKNVMSWFDISNLIDGQTYTIQVNITNVTQGNFSWQDIQIELGTTATEYTPYVADFSGVGVSRYGANVFKPYNAENTVNGVTAKLTEDGFVETSGEYNEGDTRINLSPPSGYEYPILPAGDYYKYLNTYNNVYLVYDIDIMFQIRYLDGSWGGNVGSTSGTVSFSKPCRITNIVINIKTSNGANMRIPAMMGFVGLNITEFEPFKEPQTTTVDADGTVEGLTSLSPNMTLLTDTEGVTINCQYYRDIDTYINNLATNIALTGGN